MNARLDALIEQAEVWDTTGDVDKCELDPVLFAQLIVRECADLCSDLDGGENMFSRGIRKHFGVE